MALGSNSATATTSESTIFDIAADGGPIYGFDIKCISGTLLVSVPGRWGTFFYEVAAGETLSVSAIKTSIDKITVKTAIGTATYKWIASGI